jgi:hypothetical protein
MEIYKTSLDIRAKIITAFSFMIWLVPTTTLFWLFIIRHVPFKLCIIFILLFSIFPVIFFCIYIAYRVKYYQITAAKLIIKRQASRFDKKIALSDIESIRVPDKVDFKWSNQRPLVPGIFGYYGWNYNKKLGYFRTYASNRKNRIFITLKNSKYNIAISPDDTGMVDDLQKLLKKAS